MENLKKLHLAVGVSLMLPLTAAQYDPQDMQEKVKKLFTIGLEKIEQSKSESPFYTPPLQEDSKQEQEDEESSSDENEEPSNDIEAEDFPLNIQEIPPSDKTSKPHQEAKEQKAQEPSDAKPQSSASKASIPKEKIPDPKDPHTIDLLESTPANSQTKEGEKPSSEAPLGEKPVDLNSKHEESDKEIQEIRLKPAGTWTEQEANLYRMPSTAIKGIKGIDAPYELWIDPYEWEETEDLNVHADRSFKSTEGTAYAIVVAQKKKISLNDLDDIVIKNASESGFEKVSVIDEQKRLVNGQEVLFLHWQADINGKPVDFLSYLYTNGEWVILLHTYTPKDFLKKNQQTMEHFLDGVAPTKSS